MDFDINVEMHNLLVNTLMILGVSTLLRALFAVIFKKKKHVPKSNTHTHTHRS